jgi:hypothetical protein
MKPVRKAVFPVAGRGTRFLPATKAMPKEMLPIVDKPLIQYAVEEVIGSGITELIFVTGRNKRAIEDHFDSSPELEAELAAQNKTDLIEVINSMPRAIGFELQQRFDACVAVAVLHHLDAATRCAVPLRGRASERWGLVRCRRTGRKPGADRGAASTAGGACLRRDPIPALALRDTQRGCLADVLGVRHPCAATPCSIAGVTPSIGQRRRAPR